jgi:hypothetical protein
MTIVTGAIITATIVRRHGITVATTAMGTTADMDATATETMIADADDAADADRSRVSRGDATSVPLLFCSRS